MVINCLVGIWDTSKQPTGLILARGLISWLSPKCLSYHYQLERRANLPKGQSQPPQILWAINCHAILLLWRGKHIPSGGWFSEVTSFIKLLWDVLKQSPVQPKVTRTTAGTTGCCSATRSPEGLAGELLASWGAGVLPWNPPPQPTAAPSLPFCSRWGCADDRNDSSSGHNHHAQPWPPASILPFLLLLLFSPFPGYSLWEEMWQLIFL